MWFCALKQGINLEMCYIFSDLCRSVGTNSVTAAVNTRADADLETKMRLATISRESAAEDGKVNVLPVKHTAYVLKRLQEQRQKGVVMADFCQTAETGSKHL